MSQIESTALCQEGLNHPFNVLKKIVMVATTGRSGSLFLANLINRNAFNASSEHEPRIAPVDETTGWYYTGEKDKLARLVNRKLARLARGDKLSNSCFLPADRLGSWPIARRAMRIPRVPIREVYVEVNNSFLKSFGPILVELEPSVQVVHLTRDPCQVAKSAANRKCYPNGKRSYYLWPSWPGNELMLEQNVAESLTPFQLGLWYWVEMELRFSSLKERFPNLQTVEIDLNELNDADRIASFFSDLGIEHGPLSTDVDTHKGAKPNRVGDTELTEARELLRLLPDGTLERISNTYQLEDLS